jgi:hypothetical protein
MYQTQYTLCLCMCIYTMSIHSVYLVSDLETATIMAIPQIGLFIAASSKSLSVTVTKNSEGLITSCNGNPLIDGRLTVRLMRRVDWTC